MMVVGGLGAKIMSHFLSLHSTLEHNVRLLTRNWGHIHKDLKINNIRKIFETFNVSLIVKA